MNTKQNYKLGRDCNKTKSVSDALMFRECEKKSSMGEAVLCSESAFEALKRKDIDLYIVARMLSETGCRISEVLQMWGTDINMSGKVLIRSKKKGNNRVCNISNQFIKEIPRAGQSCELIQDKDRFYFYREFKKVGISLSIEGYERNRVTHAFRHEYTKQIRTLTTEKDVIKNALGHKSEKSQENYGR